MRKSKRIFTFVCVVLVVAMSFNSTTLAMSLVNSGREEADTRSDGTTVYHYYHIYLLDTPLENDAVEAIYTIPDNPDNILLMQNEALEPDYLDDLFNVESIRHPTFVYNCHSYAWHSQSATNLFWISDPYFYYHGGGYSEVTTPMVGDIICYFDDNDTPSSTADDRNLHSGIVVEVLNTTSNGLCGTADTVVVDSKWGEGGLYRHNGYISPYTDYVLTILPNALEKDRAEYVKYYRRTGHTHNHNTDSNINHAKYHQSACSCGQIIHEAHTGSSYTDVDSIEHHIKNCACGYSGYEAHTWAIAYINPNNSPLQIGVYALGGEEISPQAIAVYRCEDCGYTSPSMPPDYNS